MNAHTPTHITNANYRDAIKHGWFANATYVSLANLPGITALPDMPAATGVSLYTMPGVPPIADDGEYKLYRSRTGGYYAGCRAFRCAADALRHWDRADDRARMFTAAIRKAEGK